MSDAFHPLNPFSDVHTYRLNLLHWRQENATYFVTWRLADALPQSKLEQLKSERNAWLRTHGIQSKEQIENLPDDQRHEYHNLFTERVHQWLDAGMGSCVLRPASCSQMVADALHHFDGPRYTLDRFVIMPNHVHVLVSPNKEWQLDQILHSWKSYSASALNRFLDRKGVLWLEETWDHIVRSVSHLERFRAYISENPLKARLRKENFCLGCGSGIKTSKGEG